MQNQTESSWNAQGIMLPPQRSEIKCVMGPTCFISKSLQKVAGWCNNIQKAPGHHQRMEIYDILIEVIVQTVACQIMTSFSSKCRYHCVREICRLHIQGLASSRKSQRMAASYQMKTSRMQWTQTQATAHRVPYGGDPTGWTIITCMIWGSHNSSHEELLSSRI